MLTETNGKLNELKKTLVAKRIELINELNTPSTSEKTRSHWEPT